ncbi:hypothetical protein G6F35_016621 [Rhizopus arrhizus]|nr:hypothetical protein G6F35_016621 [Rhizopus arrhizus]
MAGDTQRRAIGTGEARSHRGAGSPIGFKDGIGGDDAMLPAAPGVPEGEGLGRRLAARVERGQLAGLVQSICLRQGADQAPAAGHGFPLRHRLVARVMLNRPAHEHALVARPHVVLADGGRLLAHPELLQQQLGVLQGLVMAAHGTLPMEGPV